MTEGVGEVGMVERYEGKEAWGLECLIIRLSFEGNSILHSQP